MKNTEIIKNSDTPKFDAKSLDIDKLKEEIGKYVVANMQLRKKTFVKLIPFEESKKNEMFNLFCITWDEPNESGDYICRIDGFRKDKAGAVYMVAKPIVKLTNLHYTGNCWNIILSSGMFWSPYNAERELKKGRLNTDLLFGKLCISNKEDAAKLVLEKLISGETNLDEISKWLNTADDYEKVAKKLLNMYRSKNLYNYPNLINRLYREKMDVLKAREFLMAEHAAYNKLGFSGAAGYIEEAEQVLQYYADKKEAEKVARKEKRKNK